MTVRQRRILGCMMILVGLLTASLPVYRLWVIESLPTRPASRVTLTSITPIAPAEIEEAPSDEDIPFADEIVVACAEHIMDEPTLKAARANHPECLLIYLDMKDELETAHRQPLF